ncbi:hypothetical protein QBC46DRAFT_398835 [Diplogelasinospora grovesii]|uniref:Mucoidy inhibitor-like protein n=1 Tax=Diplogelasinospora grovesii TaxID=303347 RepID=A0AAN6MWY0_9PEZI|nr:hypothetical protein QBC46DRAFT_398835 [Diplogelasinospora grovesii]
MDTTHKQEFHVRSLSTRSVTLFPTRAQVVREIKDVVLKPGANEITVVGLTPTADEHSIKVEGTGSAIITDITVELLPNRDIFQEIYPDSEDSEKDQSEDEEDDDRFEESNEALEDVRETLTALRDEEKCAKEAIASAESRLKILDAYGKSLDKKRGIDIETGVETYRKEREKVFKDRLDGTVRVRNINIEIEKLAKEEGRLLQLSLKKRSKEIKAKEKVQKAKNKEKEKERRREAERLKEKARIRKERENFWAKSCYSLRISLDAAGFTPSSSRRSSITSVTELVKAGPEKEPSEDSAAGYTCDLSISYVTSSAFWSPSYDLALSTTTSTAMLCFDAQLTNMTSETWSNCKVILSTSQTTFSGLQDAIPTLVPWRVKLAGKGSGALGDDIINSREERDQQGDWFASQNNWHAQKPRAELFGVNNKKGSQRSAIDAYSRPALLGHAPAAQSIPPAPMAAFGGTQNLAAPGGGGFGAPAAQPIAHQFSQRLMVEPMAITDRDRARERGQTWAHKKRASPGKLEEDDEDEAVDGATILEPTPELSFQESSFEETGLTATYDLPTLKTLKPSSTASKQRVARISFTNVVFSRTVVAKYKPVAYLKARIRNTSKLTLLKGPTGLTLDGTFMGRSTLPRCSAGDTFTMTLGVDPAIKVSYPKPDVKRSTTGVFTKGDNSVYTRTVTLVNTRAAAGQKPVNITVLDQVPVSEDEKLRIDILHPKFTGIGGGVSAGVPGKDAKEDKDWGKAVATLKKAGEITWDVSLNGGRSVKLMLEYEVALPVGERVVQCS